jgi:hypothetical protein
LHKVKIKGALVKGQVEMQIRGRISNARIWYGNLSAEYKTSLNDDIIKMVIAAAQEEIFNAYEEACQKYLDGKVDKKRFKKLSN